MPILSILASDKSVIIYRKELNAITGSVTATLLLSQIIYWHSKSGCFYKFNKPCSHPLYKAGDSWEEELFFSTGELRSAMSNLKNAGLISSHTDNQRLTKYTLHTAELELALASVYKQQQPTVKTTTSSCKINNNQLLNCDLPLLTETTTETTHKTLVELKPDPAPTPAKTCQKTEQAKTILETLNLRAGKNFRPVASNLGLIKARLADGATHEDLISVIDRKCQEWLDDPKMAQFLRPKTLFNATNFNNYLGDIGSPLPEKLNTKQEKEQVDWNTTGWIERNESFF